MANMDLSLFKDLLVLIGRVALRGTPYCDLIPLRMLIRRLKNNMYVQNDSDILWTK